MREEKWVKSLISPVERAERFAQRPLCLLITGDASTPRRDLARSLEAQLFREGRAVYFLGIGSMLRGLDRDIHDGSDVGQEHVRRVGELGNIMLDAGMLFIVSAANLSASDVALVQELVGVERVRVALMSNDPNATADLVLKADEPIESGIEKIKTLLAREGVIFRPW